MKPAELERRQTSPQQLEVVLHLDPALPWFRGHFAVQPLLPGVAQIDCCRALSSRSVWSGRKPGNS